MPDTNPLTRPQTAQVVKPFQNAVQPNRNLENKLDRLMVGALTRPQLSFGLE